MQATERNSEPIDRKALRAEVASIYREVFQLRGKWREQGAELACITPRTPAVVAQIDLLRQALDDTARAGELLEQLWARVQ